MIRYLREFRLIPIVLFATVSLFALKTASLLIVGHYALDEPRNVDDDITGTIPGGANGMPKDSASKAGTQGKQAGTSSWAQQMFNYPDVTGSAGAGKGEAKPEAAPAKPAHPKPQEPPPSDRGWKPVQAESGRVMSPAGTPLLGATTKPWKKFAALA